MAYNTKPILYSGQDGVPQIYDPANDNYLVLTGADLGGGRHGQDAISWGKTSSGLLVPIQVDANGVVQTNGKQTNYDSSGVEKFTDSNPGSMKLTGSNATEAYLFNALAIADTSVHFGSNIKTAGYRKAAFYITNTLNQAVNINPLAGTNLQGGQVYSTKYSDGSVANKQFTIGAGASQVIDDMPFRSVISLIAQCTTAPTSGALTVILMLY